MNGLSAFFMENAIKPENVKYAASKRFLDEDGKPIEWEIRAISSAEDEDIRRKCMKKVSVPGRKNQFTTETDVNLYLGRLAAECTVFPDLKSAELQDSYKVRGEDILLKKMLTAGEYADYCQKVQEVCGFDISFDEEVEEAKNL